MEKEVGRRRGKHMGCKKWWGDWRGAGGGLGSGKKGEGERTYVGDREGGGAEEGGGAAHSTFHARLVLNVTRMFYSRRRGLD